MLDPTGGQDPTTNRQGGATNENTAENRRDQGTGALSSSSSSSTKAPSTVETVKFSIHPEAADMDDWMGGGPRV